MSKSVADPGFPVGGVDSQGGYVSKILYVETKESGPLEGGCTRHAPRSTNYVIVMKWKNTGYTIFIISHNIVGLFKPGQYRTL